MNAREFVEQNYKSSQWRESEIAKMMDAYVDYKTHTMYIRKKRRSPYDLNG